MNINDLAKGDSFRDVLKDANRRLIDKDAIHRKLAVQSAENENADLGRKAKSLTDMANPAFDAIERGRKVLNQLSNPALDAVNQVNQHVSDLARRSHSLADPARDAMRRVSDLQKQLERAPHMVRALSAQHEFAQERIRSFEYAQKRIAEFENAQAKLRQFDDLQKRLNQHDSLMQSAGDFTRSHTHDLARRAQELFSDRLDLGAAARLALNTVQERAVMGFAAQESFGEQARRRIQEMDLGRQQKTLLQNALSYGDIFARSTRASESLLREMTLTVHEAVQKSETVEEAIESVTTIVEAKAESGAINTYQLWTIVVAIIPILLGFYQIHLTHTQIADAKRSGDEQKEFQAAMLNAIRQLIEKTEKPRQEGVEYLAERDADVKEQPNFKSPTVDRIPKNSRIRILLMQHKWVFVEYLESLNLERRSGWVNKKYLRRIR